MKRELIQQLYDQVRDPRNRLEVHGMAHRMNGFPIYDEDNYAGDPIGEITEPLWDWEKDLTLDDKDYFWKMVGTVQRGFQMYGTVEDRKYFTHPKIMGTLIEEYGIQCWHYPMHRRPQGALLPPFECLVCQSLFVPGEPPQSARLQVVK